MLPSPIQTVIIRFVIISTLLGVTISHAASINVSNITGGGSDLALLDSGGLPLQSGFFGLYLFGTEALSIPPADVTALKANGDTGRLATIALSAGNAPGNGSFFASFQNFTNNVANGNLYLVVGNGADAANSTGLLMVDITGLDNLNGVDTPTPQSLGTYQLLSGDVEIGTIGPSQTFDWTDQTGNATYTTPTLSLVAIPEPSSAWLVMVGSFVAVMRRRRQR